MYMQRRCAKLQLTELTDEVAGFTAVRCRPLVVTSAFSFVLSTVQAGLRLARPPAGVSQRLPCQVTKNVILCNQWGNGGLSW